MNRVNRKLIKEIVKQLLKLDHVKLFAVKMTVDRLINNDNGDNER